MPGGNVPVFISYHGPDYELAKEIKTSLKKVVGMMLDAADEPEVVPARSRDRHRLGELGQGPYSEGL